MYIKRFILTLLLSTSLVFAHTPSAQSGEIDQDEEMLLSHLSKSEKLETVSELQKVKAKALLISRFDQEIEKADMMNEPLEESILRLENQFKKTLIKVEQMKLKLLRPHNLARMVHSMRKQSKLANVEDLKKTIEQLYSVNNMQNAQQFNLKLLKQAGSFSVYLKLLKEKSLSMNMQQADNSDGALEGILFVMGVIILVLAVIGLPIWGALALFAIGTSLAMVGGVVLSVIAGTIVIMIVLFLANCPFDACEIKQKQKNLEIHHQILLVA